jgi:phosphoadenosine phosphosulfate reductase
MHIEKLADEFDSKTAQEVLKWALDTFGTKIALASSFGAEDVVIIDKILLILDASIKRPMM